MRIIQTFVDENFKCGFPTKKSCLKYLRASYAVHAVMCETVIYTDADGGAYLAEFAPELNIQVFEYDHIDDRFWNLPKLQTQALQTDAYIHVDIDATLFELPATFKHITERFGVCASLSQCFNVGIAPAIKRPLSGLIGFSDMQFKALYINTAIEHITNWPLKSVDEESIITVEELLLINISDATDWFELPAGTFEHLQGGQKK